MGEVHGEEVLGRLRRIEGQVSGIRRMQEDGRSCVEVLDQIAAARAGLDAAALLMLEDHIHGCLRGADEDGDRAFKTAEMFDVVRRFVRSK